MVDESDFAKELADREIETRINAAARGIEMAVTDGRETCAECGVEIPEARRKACPGAFRCVECQETHERLAR